MYMELTTAAMIIGLGLSACTDHGEGRTAKNKIDTPTNPPMKNMLFTVEVPTTDLNRAIGFYESLLDIRIEEMDMGDTRMGILPSDEGTVSLVLVHGEGYVPSGDGTTAYLEAGEDLQPVLNKVLKHGGQVVVPKTEITPELGYFALFLDTEGNKVGLHSSR